jgi:hypothetical protein
MKCILVNTQLSATEHTGSSSAMLAYIATRRQAQSDELRAFLAEVNNCITEASLVRHAAAGGATESWIDFISGWLSKVDTDLVEPDTIVQAAKTALPSSVPVTTSPSDSLSRQAIRHAPPRQSLSPSPAQVM